MRTCGLSGEIAMGIIDVSGFDESIARGIFPLTADDLVEGVVGFDLEDPTHFMGGDDLLTIDDLVGGVGLVA